MREHFLSGESVMLHTGKCISYICSFVRYSECERFSFVDVDLSPEPRIVRLRVLSRNITKYDWLAK